MNGVKGILLMAGQGRRFSAPEPKQFHLLAGEKIYLRTLDRFVTSNLFDEIILVCDPEFIPQVQAEATFAHRVVAGGATRQESSYQGLLACGSDTEIVVIHDAVRPFVSYRILEENIRKAKEFGAVDTCIPNHDTLIQTKDGKTISSIPSRSELMRGQTPQSFSYPLILKAHQECKRSDSTDDCTLVHDQKHPIHIVLGEDLNMKITTPFDLLIAEKALQKIDP